MLQERVQNLEPRAARCAAPTNIRKRLRLCRPPEPEHFKRRAFHQKEQYPKVTEPSAAAVIDRKSIHCPPAPLRQPPGLPNWGPRKMGVQGDVNMGTECPAERPPGDSLVTFSSLRKSLAARGRRNPPPKTKGRGGAPSRRVLQRCGKREQAAKSLRKSLLIPAAPTESGKPQGGNRV